VGYLALHRYLQGHPAAKGYFLETAHPLKFPESVERLTKQSIPVPVQVVQVLKGEKKSIITDADYISLRDFLLRFR
jgi:threonine synthase